MTSDTASLRQYGVALSLCINEIRSVSISQILDPSQVVYRYTGDTLVNGSLPATANAYKLLSSEEWYLDNVALAPSLSPTARAYTVNETLFPYASATAANPNPPKWQRDPVSSVSLKMAGIRPFLFTGIMQGGNSAYSNGTRAHTNPIYSGINKTSADITVNGKTLVLFTDFSCRICDFSTENNGKSYYSDPQGWWIQM